MTLESLKCVKMHLRPGFHPRPHWGAYSTPRPPDWIWGKEWGRDGEGKEEEGKGRGGRLQPPNKNSGYGLGKRNGPLSFRQCILGRF